jgi:uncharacterized damage-inducible protein DinB
MDTEALVLQLRYSAWACRRVLEAAASLSADELHRDLGNSYGGVHGTLKHIYQADAIWFDRLMGAPTTDLSKYEPGADFSEWARLHDDYVKWAEGLTPAEWDRVVSYRNTAGEPFQTAVWKIVLHLVNHASYHRGQITTLLRQIGRPPIGTDLITYYRSLSAAAGN